MWGQGLQHNLAAKLCFIPHLTSVVLNCRWFWSLGEPFLLVQLDSEVMEWWIGIGDAVKYPTNVQVFWPQMLIGPRLSRVLCCKNPTLILAAHTVEEGARESEDLLCELCLVYNTQLWSPSSAGSPWFSDKNSNMKMHIGNTGEVICKGRWTVSWRVPSISMQ